jgi:hypothetical protein
MITKIKILCLLILLVSNFCNAQKIPTTNKKISTGKWICVQDSLSTIVVKGNVITMYYDNVSVDTTTYTITKQLCDITYKPSKKDALFLLWQDGICSEIEYITKQHLMLIYTATGRLTTYRKEK